MEFDSANTKEELPLTLLKLKNIELENNLLLEKQKYILLQSELESTKLIASKHVDVYKSECMRLKEIILMLENDYNSFKKKMKNQEVVKNLCKKIKKIEETVSSKHENLEENDTEWEKNYAKESELRNKSVIVDINSDSDGYVPLSSMLDNAFIRLKNDSRSQMEKNLLSESLPFFEVESLRGKEKSVEIADVASSLTFTKLNRRERRVGIKVPKTRVKQMRLNSMRKLAEPKVKSALKSMSKGASTSKFESKGESISKSELKDKTSSKKSSGRRTKSKKSGKSNSSEELRMTIRHILKNVDFDTATFTDIFNRLDTRYKDLTPWKAYVRLMYEEELIKLADELENKEESSDAEKDQEPNAKKVKV